MTEINPAPLPVPNHPEKRLPKTGVVTFLDVLGWKGIYHREDAPIAKLANLVKSLSGSDVQYRGLDLIPKIRSISDTIVIYSTGVKDEDATRVIDMHGDICARAIALSITDRIPVRGATSFGEFEVQENIYVGKAIDEAASWYECGDWIGVHLTPSAMYCIDGTLKNWDDYQAPLKGGAKHSTPSVNWLGSWRKAVPDQDPRRELQKVFRAMGPITPDFAMKFVHTLSYFDELVRREKSTVAHLADQGPKPASP